MLICFTAWALQWGCSGQNPTRTTPSGSLPSVGPSLAYLHTISESARTCSPHITQKTAPESRWLLKMRQTKFVIASMYPLLPEGSLKPSSGCRGCTAPPQLQLQAEGMCSLWFSGLTLAFSLALLSLWLFWLESRTCLWQQQKPALMQLSINQREGAPPDTLSRIGVVSISSLPQISSPLMELIAIKAKLPALGTTTREMNNHLCLSVMCINNVRVTIAITSPESLGFVSIYFYH